MKNLKQPLSNLINIPLVERLLYTSVTKCSGRFIFGARPCPKFKTSRNLSNPTKIVC